MPTISERLKEVLEETKEFGLTQRGLALACDVKESSVSDWISGKTKNLKNEHLVHAADYLGVHIRWLATGDAPKVKTSLAGDSDLQHVAEGTPITDDQYCFVPRVRGVILSAGPGHTSWDHEEIDKSHAFTRSWMRSKGINPRRARIISVEGDSMAPYVFSGDVVLVNLEENRIRSGEIFAINVDGETRIKRLIRRADGALEIRSDNPSPQYPPEVLRGDEIDQLKIIGKVVWRGG